MKRIPEPCQYCAWYRGARQCAVFVSLFPQGWTTPDGRCEAYADPRRHRVLVEQMERYAQSQTQVTA